MEYIKEIEALINLVDDEDENIFFQVRDKLLSYGAEAVPFLEDAWEVKNLGKEFQSRIEDIIHEIQFNDVSEGLKNWVDNGGKNLLTGILLVNKHHYPDLDIGKLKAQLLDMASIIGSTFQDTMNVRQKVAAINRGIYSHYHFRGDNENYYSPKNSILSDVMERKKGNPLMLSVLYIEIARLLNVNVVGVNLPRHFVVAVKEETILFYLSPFNRGTFLSNTDLASYLSKLNLPQEDKFLDECSNIDIVKRVLLNLINAYMKQKDKEKVAEINELYKIFKD